MEFRNDSGLSFEEIDSEVYREYRFPSGQVLRIDQPLKIHVSPTGGHRILSRTGKCYYVAPSWESITWTVYDGSPHFVK